MRSPQHTGSRDTEPDTTLATATRRWVILAIGCVVGFIVVYIVAVLTPWGQDWENAAIAGSGQVLPWEATDVDDDLDLIQTWSLAIAILIVGVIGLSRRQVRTAFAGMGVIVVGVLLSEALKRFVLWRPDLAAAAFDSGHNSFPSGHTTIAMTLIVAMIIVVPFRWRGLAMIIVMTWAGFIGAFTVIVHWHRLSDTLAADMLALCLGSLASLWLLKVGRVRAYAGPPVSRARVVYVWVAALVAAAGLIAGLVFGVLAVVQGLASSAGQYDAYISAQLLAAAGSLTAALGFWATWRGLEVPDAVKA
ncbi:hypothetical protein GCM10009808_11260 [Microbacterium sediminicola]|uniref:Phosphatidic acid phosphatase type 2/haloperoxidase domain-containing protein n=1 Tax=Microbacterium sediminicola TaxID=415210 RepID=A0ABP4TZR1_9MICO